MRLGAFAVFGSVLVGAPGVWAQSRDAEAPEVTVLVQGEEPAAEPRSTRGFSSAEVRQLPGALGDPLRALEPLPGVTPTLSGVPYFFVRGAPPGDVGYFFDRMRMPALFHALGGPAVVHPSLIDSVELYPGPYPVEYGKFAAAVVTARAAEPSVVPHGEVALRATDSSALIDTPVGPDSNLTLAGRYSYANPILHLFSRDMDVAYWDYQGRMTHRLSSSDRLTLMAFGAHDLLTDLNDGKQRTLYGIDFHRVALRLEHRLEHGSFSLQALGGWDRSAASDGDVKVRDLSTELRADAVQRLTRRLTLRAGASAGSDHYDLDVEKLDDVGQRRRYELQFPSRLESSAGAYVALDAAVGAGIVVTPGLRADAYSSRGRRMVALDPRVNAEFRVSRNVTLDSALGVAHQPPASSVPSPGLNPALGEGLQTGVQQSYGVRWRLPAAGTTLEVTFFQNALFNLSDSIGQSRISDTNDSVTEDTRGMGHSRGFELMLKRSLTRKFGGFLAYTLSSNQRAVGRASAPSSFDRRHVLSAALSYAWGGGVRSGLRGTFYTGIPADVAYLEAARDPPRTTPFYRIDVRTEKRFSFKDARYLSLVFEVVNTTLNREVLTASCNAFVCKERRVGPVTIPNLGLEGGF